MKKQSLKFAAIAALITMSSGAAAENVSVKFLNCGYVKEGSKNTYGYENGDDIKAWKDDCSDSQSFGFEEIMKVSIISDGETDHNMLGAKHWGCDKDKKDDKAAKDVSGKAWVSSVHYILAFRDQVKYKLYAVAVSSTKTLSCDLLTKTPPNYQELP